MIFINIQLKKYNYNRDIINKLATIALNMNVT